MKLNLKKLLCAVLTVIMLFTVCASPALTVSAAKTSKYSDFIKYRGQDLKNTYAKLKKGEEVNVLYYGGSVTNGTGATNAEKYSWRALVGTWLTETFPKAKVNNINVAYGGTGSFFGAYRLKEEVISKKPDLIFIEFAINDHYDNQVRTVSKETASMQYETIVRNIWAALPECDIITVLTTEKGYITTNRAGELHIQAQGHEDISIAYNIPSIHIGRALVNELSYDNLSGDWEKYMTDIVHPTNAGYKVYFNVIKEYLSNCLKDGGYNGKVTKHTLPRQVNDYLLDGNIQFIDANKALLEKSDTLGGRNFSYDDNASTLRGFPGGLKAEGGNSKLVVEFTGTELSMIQHSDTVSDFQVVIDKKTTKYVKCYGIKPEVLVSGLKYGKHTVSISPVYEDGADAGLFWVQGFFARDETKRTAKYDHAKHVFKKYVSNKDATCKKDGTKTAKCTVSGCDMTDTVTDEGSKLAHKYKINVTKKATDTKDGEGEKVCTLCGRFEGTVVIPKGKTAEDVIASETSKTEASSSKTESSESEISASGESTASDGTVSADGSSSQTAAEKQNTKKAGIPLGLKIALVSVLSLLVIAIGVLVFVIIKRKKDGTL